MNNITKLKLYNFFVMSSEFGYIHEKLLQFTCYITDLRKSHFEMSQENLKHNKNATHH